MVDGTVVSDDPQVFVGDEQGASVLGFVYEPWNNPLVSLASQHNHKRCCGPSRATGGKKYFMKLEIFGSISFFFDKREIHSFVMSTTNSILSFEANWMLQR